MGPWYPRVAFKGATDKPLPNEDGATINGSISDGTAIESRTTLSNDNTLGVEAGKTVQLAGAGPFIATSITVPADAKLLIPAGVTLTIGNGGTTAPV
jgi:hypothetical protein